MIRTVYAGGRPGLAVTETAAHAHLLERRGLVTESRTQPPAYTADLTPRP